MSNINNFNESITFMHGDNHGMRRKKEVTLNDGNHNQKSTTLMLCSTGYAFNFSGTTYAFQGLTVPKLIGDFNTHYNKKITLNDVCVTMSRVERSIDFRIIPWSTDKDKENMLNLKFPDVYLLWNQAYDNNGKFQINNLKRRNFF